MIHTIRRRLKQLKKNGNIVNVLADSAGSTLTLTSVKVKSVSEDCVVFKDGTTETTIAFHKLLDVEF